MTQRPAPPVMMWFRIYAAALSLLYVAVAIGAVFLFFGLGEWMEMDRREAFFIGVVCLVSAIPFAFAFAAGLFLPPKPWVWIYDLVLIAIGFGSCCILPASVALLVFWIRPETKAYFNRL